MIWFGLLALILFGMAVIVGFRAEDTRDDVGDLAPQIVDIRVNTCGTGNDPACDRVCEETAARLVVSFRGAPLEVRCRNDRKGPSGQVDPAQPSTVEIVP